MPQHLKTSSLEQGPAKMNVKGRASEEDEMNEQEEDSDKQHNPFFWRNDRETLEKLKGRHSQRGI
ncbi:hypothetical protein TrVFT333_001921 [Trichoderma virens FT-333]|nr:hypothetical protein TrVFT333_001921 [Trichoderma virens FT-333]